MDIYQVTILEKEIEQQAKQNEGEIDEELLKELIEAQTKSIDKIEGICHYLKSLDLFQKACKDEESRIKGLRDRAEKRQASIKKYITPFVAEKGKMTAGTFQLSTRKSKSIEIEDGFFIEDYMVQKIPPPTPDKAEIKKALESGKEIKGAKIVEKDNLQIK